MRRDEGRRCDVATHRPRRGCRLAACLMCLLLLLPCATMGATPEFANGLEILAPWPGQVVPVGGELEISVRLNLRCPEPDCCCSSASRGAWHEQALAVEIALVATLSGVQQRTRISEHRVPLCHGECEPVQEDGLELHSRALAHHLLKPRSVLLEVTVWDDELELVINTYTYAYACIYMYMYTCKCI